MEVQVPYGRVTLTLDVARETLQGIYRPSDVPVAAPAATQVLAALQHPLGGPGLDRLAAPGTRVAIAVDDNTRVTPTWRAATSRSSRPSGHTG
jgi:nickel-dependent lactate racemase